MEGRVAAAYALIVTLKAFNDVVQARDWYEKQWPGLRADFISKVEEALEMIESNPLIYPVLVKEAVPLWNRVQGRGGDCRHCLSAPSQTPGFDKRPHSLILQSYARIPTK